MRRLARILGSLTMALGISLLLAAGAVYSYGAYERYRFEQTMAAQAPADVPVPTNASVVKDQAAPEGQGGSLEAPSSADIVPEPATPTVEKSRWTAPARWIRIPKIRVDSRVVESPLENREWQVPKFVVGHLEGTANPGEIGNVVLTGHVESISSGNVFARLKELAVGDAIVLSAGENEVRYSVTEIKVVQNDDLSVVMPTPDPVLTLITCAGTWNPLTRDYTHRLIVGAKPDR